jgi:Fur family ferric uptake transcriptional regulator
VAITADDLVAALRNHGLRLTPARRAVCGVMADSHGDHVTAADVHRRTESEAGLTIDQSTVYRTLDTLEETGLITHTHVGHGASAYHLANEAPHQHLVCGSCGVTRGILAADLAGMLAEITVRTGFVPDPTHFALRGLCADCVAAGSPAHAGVAAPGRDR